jgi:uncharacterized membrane protein
MRGKTINKTFKGADMKKKIISLVTIVMFAFLIMGCETVKEHKGAATGAGVGAATGAAAGAVLGKKGSKTEAAIIGGLVGALLGGVIGHYAYDKKRTRQETAQKYDYQSSEGTRVRIEDVSAVPATVKPGDKVELGATYALLSPSADADIKITEIREIRHEGELVGRPEVTVTHKGGTYSTTVPLFLPQNAKKGTYRVLTTIQGPNAQDSRETTLVVK